MRFSTFVFRNVLRRRIRSTLTMTGMAVAVTFVVVLVGLANGLSKSMLKLYVNRGVSLIVTDKGSISPLSGTIPAKVATEIRKLDGVDDTCAGLVDFQAIDEFGSEPVGIQGWPAGNYMFRELKIVDGENLSDRDPGSKGIIVGSTLAAVKSLKTGQPLTINGTEFHIVGVFDSAEDIENGMVVMLLDDAQKVLGKTGLITGCTVKVKDTSEASITAIRTQIEGPVAEACKVPGKIRAKSPGDFVKQNGQVRLITAFAWLVSIVTLVISGILVLNTMFMAVLNGPAKSGFCGPSVGALARDDDDPDGVNPLEHRRRDRRHGGRFGDDQAPELRAHGHRRRPAGHERRYRRQGVCHCHCRRAVWRRLSSLSRFMSATDGGLAP